MTDKEIIGLFFARDENALTEIKVSYGLFCRRIIFAVIRCNEDVDECENDTYLKAWNVIPPNEPQSLKYFTGRIARNTALDRYRAENAQKRSAVTDVSFDELEECIPLTDVDFDERQLGKAIDSFLRTLSTEKRVVFIRKYWFFDTISEISLRLDMSESKVKSMLMRTRGELRKYLEREGYSL